MSRRTSNMMPGPADPRCLVSVVIVSWNTRELLRECLASTLVAAAELGGTTQIIVVDNASTDGSAAMVREEFPSVEVLRNDVNAGFAVATNQGLRASRGRHLMLLNPDTKTTPGFLRVLVSFLDQHPAAGAVGPRTHGRHGEHQVTAYKVPTLATELWRLFHLDRFYQFAYYPETLWRSDVPQRVEVLVGACILLRREALEQTGLLDERFFIYTEEVDLCRRLQALDWQLYWVPRALIVHYGGASTSQVASRMFLELYRSKVQYFRKHLGVSGAWAYKTVLFAATLPRLLVTTLGFALLPSRREEFRSTLKNYSSLLVQLPAL